MPGSIVSTTSSTSSSTSISTTTYISGYYGSITATQYGYLVSDLVVSSRFNFGICGQAISGEVTSLSPSSIVVSLNNLNYTLNLGESPRLINNTYGCTVALNSTLFVLGKENAELKFFSHAPPKTTITTTVIETTTFPVANTTFATIPKNNYISIVEPKSNNITLASNFYKNNISTSITLLKSKPLLISSENQNISISVISSVNTSGNLSFSILGSVYAKIPKIYNKTLSMFNISLKSPSENNISITTDIHYSCKNQSVSIKPYLLVKNQWVAENNFTKNIKNCILNMPVLSGSTIGIFSSTLPILKSISSTQTTTIIQNSTLSGNQILKAQIENFLDKFGVPILLFIILIIGIYYIIKGLSNDSSEKGNKGSNLKNYTLYDDNGERYILNDNKDGVTKNE